MQTTPHGTSIFQHNDDYTDNVEIRHKNSQINLPIQDLLDFVAEIVVHRRVSDLEDQTTEQILGIPDPDAMAEKIYSCLNSQKFVDWNNGKYSDHIGDSTFCDRADIIKDIKRLFRL